MSNDGWLERFRYMLNSQWILIIKQSAAIIVIASMLGFLSNSLRSESLSLFPKSVSPGQDVVGASPLISIEEAKHHFYKNTAFFLDARSKADFRRGHIKGAQHLSLHDVDDTGLHLLETIPPEGMIITYCEGEHCRLSFELADFLITDGFKNVNVLKDGWTLWQAHNLPVEMNQTADP